VDAADKTVDWANLPTITNGYSEARKAIVDRIEKLATADKQLATQR